MDFARTAASLLVLIFFVRLADVTWSAEILSRLRCFVGIHDGMSLTWLNFNLLERDHIATTSPATIRR